MGWSYLRYSVEIGLKNLMMDKQEKIIVCIDDERIILFALRIQLERLLTKDFTIECFTDGEEAIEFIQKSIDEGRSLPLVITDEMMPKMRGHEIIEKLSIDFPQIRCLLLTGYASSDVLAELPKKFPLVEIMAKPWKQADLVETVYNLINTSKES